ncbi:MAG: rod shape-determining protein [Clostridia bacterium]|nr:rod shape-determining protein [Clostridia bacterium]
MNLGIDLGTSRIVICDPSRGVVLDEPSVVAVSQKDGHMIAFGREAEEMLGRNPDTIRVVRPVQNGVIAEYELTEQLLRRCLAKVCSARIIKPCVAVSVAEKVTEVERRSFIEAVISAGARRVTLVPEAVAAAIGAGMDVSRPLGQMVLNAGGGTVDVSVLSLKGEAVSASIRVAGQAMDEAIVRYVRAQYGLIISEQTAERLKIDIGCALPIDPVLTVEAKGRDSISGLPRGVVVSSDEICEAIREPLQELLELIQQVLEVTPPELAADIITEGIWLTGGLAELRQLPLLIEHATGIACHVAQKAHQCVAIGAGKALKYASSFSAVYDLGSFSYRLSDNVTN